MKKFLILLLLSPTLFSQVRVGDQYTISAGGGIVKEGNYGTIQVDYLPTSRNSYWMYALKLTYTDQKMPTNIDINMPLQQFGANLLVGYSFENIIKHPFYIQFYVGGYGGYDKANKGKKHFSEYDIPVELKDQFNYGVSGLASIEVILNGNRAWMTSANAIALYAEFLHNYRLNSAYGKNTSFGGLGIKYYF